MRPDKPASGDFDDDRENPLLTDECGHAAVRDSRLLQYRVKPNGGAMQEGEALHQQRWLDTKEVTAYRENHLYCRSEAVRDRDMLGIDHS